MRLINVITLGLVIIGAGNWGLVGLFQFDVFASAFGGQDATAARLLYIVVGLCGLYQLVPLFGALSDRGNNPQLAHWQR